MIKNSPTDVFRVALREADAMRRQSTLLHRGLMPRGVPLSPHGEPVDVVFLLHGFLATAGVFGPLEEHLRQVGVEHIASFSYHPLRSVASLGAELSRHCDAIPARARLHLVGHSLGGVIARYYVQELGGASRVEQTISLASPFHGTAAASPFAGVLGRMAPLVRDMTPDSPLLARLRAGRSAVPHTSIVAAGDQLVSPPHSAAFPTGEVVVIQGVGHNALLFDPGAVEVVCRKINDRLRRQLAAE